MYRYILRESGSQFDSLPLTSLASYQPPLGGAHAWDDDHLSAGSGRPHSQSTIVTVASGAESAGSAGSAGSRRDSGGSGGGGSGGGGDTTSWGFAS